MTPSQLKALHEQHNPDSVYFARETMRWHGDTMRNYGVRAYPYDNGTTYWELYRKQGVGQHKLKASAFFHPETFKRVHLKEAD